MTNQEILDKIATLEKGLKNPSVPESAKAALMNKIEQLKAQVEKVEEKEEKKEEKEEKVQSELEEKIAKLEKGISNPSVPESAKAALKKKLAEAKEQLASQKKEVAEDKKESTKEIKDIKDAVKDLEKAAKTGRTTPIKKPKVQQQKRATRSAKRVAKMQQTMTQLQALVDKVKNLKEKYVKQTPAGNTYKSDLERDAGRSAKPFGYRFVGKYDYRVPTEAQIKAGKKRGTIDYEARPNRSDKYPKGYKGDIKQKLADGGMAAGDKWTLKPNGRYYRTFVVDSKDYREITEHGVTESMEELDNGKYEIVISVTEKGKEYFEKNMGNKYADGGKPKRKRYGAEDVKNPEAMQKAAAVEEAVEIAQKAYENGIFASDLSYDEYVQKVSEVTGKSYGKAYLKLAYESMKSAGYADGGKMEAKKFIKQVEKGKTHKATKMRKNSPARFSWTKEAVKDGIIKKEQLNSIPSKFMRKKYPAYITEK